MLPTRTHSASGPTFTTARPVLWTCQAIFQPSSSLHAIAFWSCFTTGRGSVFGCKPVPSIKLATNSLMYRHMEEDMDVNCGVIVEGTPLPVVGRQIFEEIVAVASGKQTKSELSGVGEEEFAPWIIGPVL